jgi:hypothetical protein
MSPPLDKTAASASGWSRATAFNNLFGPPRNRVPTTTDKHVVGEDVHASSTVAARPVSAQVASRASALNTVKTFLSRVVLTRDDMIAFNGKHFLPDAHVQEMAAILTKQNTPDVQAAMALALKNWPIHTSDQENLVGFQSVCSFLNGSKLTLNRSNGICCWCEQTTIALLFPCCAPCGEEQGKPTGLWCVPIFYSTAVHC